MEIVKYELLGKSTIIKGHFKKFLTITYENGSAILWAEIDENYAYGEREIIYQTENSNKVPEDFTYIATIKDRQGQIRHYYGSTYNFLKQELSSLFDSIMTAFENKNSISKESSPHNDKIIN